ncbi:MAG: DsrE/DsrF/DrsH-like family protein, partial [Methanomassiliicoccales archaeon]|nr:DsrE/DsrF/DrsH-like family protein [Methanomassiliicoccales archaeon]
MAETKKFAMVVAEGTFDKAMMAMMMGNTAASMGIETHIFYTFFGLNLLKKGAKPKMPGMMRFFTGMMIK